MNFERVILLFTYKPQLKLNVKLPVYDVNLKNQSIIALLANYKMLKTFESENLNLKVEKWKEYWRM